MVRPLSFDKNVVIDNATKVFWRQGYQSTTMRDIGRATNLNPGSLYGSFGNKRELFSLVLEQYYQNLTIQINNSINNAANNTDILKEFFKLVIRNSENKELNGCLLVNSLSELTMDKRFQSQITAMFTGFEELFYWIIYKGQKEGEYNPRLDPRKTAQYLINNYFGLRVQSMTEKTQEQLMEIVNNFLAILD